MIRTTTAFTIFEFIRAFLFWPSFYFKNYPLAKILKKRFPEKVSIFFSNPVNFVLTSRVLENHIETGF
jgi:hypothetical protein